MRFLKQRLRNRHVNKVRKIEFNFFIKSLTNMNILPNDILNIILGELEARDITRLMLADKTMDAAVYALSRAIAFPITDKTRLCVIDIIVAMRNRKSLKKPALTHIYNSALARNIMPVVKCLAW